MGRLESVKGTIADDGISQLGDEWLIILNCEKNPLGKQLFPSFRLDGNYDNLEPGQKVEVSYKNIRRVKEIDGIDYIIASGVSII